MSRKKKVKLVPTIDPGAAPGTLPVDETAEPTEVEILRYSETTFSEGDVGTGPRPGETCWVNVEGLKNHDLLHRLAEQFGIHRLALEDVVMPQRSKVDDYEDHLVLVIPMPTTESESGFEQLTIFIGKSFLLTFQDGTPGDCFEPVRQRLRANAGVIRKRGPDYLAYALIDTVIDSYFPIIDDMGTRLDELEDEVLTLNSRDCVTRIRDLKREIMHLKRLIRPLSECVGSLSRGFGEFIQDDTRLYLRDCLDHTRMILDALEVHRDLVTGLMDAYMSAISHRMNEVMKTLTVIATIFIPLSFIAGVYGMNFDPDASPYNMPELNWYYGYPFALFLMGATVFVLLFYFYRRGWLWGQGPGK